MAEMPRPVPQEYEQLVREGLRALDVRRLTFAIHDGSFPADPDEDTGRGSPHGRAARRLFEFVRKTGFDTVQLGPQGKTTPDNPSPYDGMLLSRSTVSIDVRSLCLRGPERLVDEDVVERAIVQEAERSAGRSRHTRASAAVDRVLDAAYRAFATGEHPSLTESFAHFRSANVTWLERDALYDALRKSHGGVAFRDWTHDGAPDPARDLWAPGASEGARAAELSALVALHRELIARYAFGQWIAHEQHRSLRKFVATLPLHLYGDLQIGMSDGDAWSSRGVILDGYAMGAPPSRTNPDGQPWNYPLLDPRGLVASPLTGRPEPALEFLLRRLEKAFNEYDGLRIDHPHGWVCPWVYRTDLPDPHRAVLQGARLHSSPDLPDHPALAALAIARPEQLNRSLPRFAEGWVRHLDAAQIDRYAVVFDAIVDAARRRGRSSSDLVCEVLSTLPYPLKLVLERHGLGRFRVLQKAKLDDPADVYRPDGAQPSDWVMLGTHDTPPVWRVIERWTDEIRDRWTAHLSLRLGLGEDDAVRLRRDRGFVVQAMFAELLSCPARNLTVFFPDLFGMTDVYNAPGTINDDNWSLRLTPDFAELYADRVARGAALNLPLALSLALAARSHSGTGANRELSRALRAAAAALERPGA